MNFGRFDLEDLIDGLSDDQMNFSDDTYDFSPKDLDDLIEGLDDDEKNFYDDFPNYDMDSPWEDDFYYQHDYPFKISFINEYILFITTFIYPIIYISTLIYLILSLDKDFINIFYPEDSPPPLDEDEDDIPF